MKNEFEKELFGEPGHELGHKSDDPFIGLLHEVIRAAVKVLAVLMVAVIVWGIGDVVYILYQRLITPPFVAATAAVVLSLGITYWLITRKN